jgi:hypothetical protein
MRLIVSVIDWEYPPSKEEIQPALLDIRKWNDLESLILAYGNGVIVELRGEGETEDIIDALRGIAKGTGASVKVELSTEEKQSLWLYREGDECYKQPIKEGGYTFINPIPQPHKLSE